MTTPSLSSATPTPHRVAYIVAKFPKLSETFVLRTLEAHREARLDLRVFSVLHARESSAHPGSAAFLGRTSYPPSLAALGFATLREFLRSPLRLTRGVLRMLAGAFPHPRTVAEVLYLSAVACAWAPAVRRFAPRHLHAEFAGAPTTTAFVLSSLTGIPYGFTGHANDIFVDAYALRAKLKEARYVITVTRYNQRYLEENWPKESADKVSVVPTGLALDEFAEFSARPRNEVFRLFSVGRFVEKKGFAYLLQACSHLKRAGRSFECVIVGDGRLRPLYERLMAEHDLGDCVQLLTPRPNPEVLELCRSSDAFVLPCVIAPDGDRDGLPHSLMEAMALGVSVISTNIIGISEMIRDGENGLLVPERDSEALAAAIARLMDDAALAERLGAAGRHTIHEEFDVRVLAGRIRSQFDKV